MKYFKKAYNDVLFLKINYLLWAFLWFSLAILILSDLKQIKDQPFQIVGVVLLFLIGSMSLKKGLSNNIQSLIKTRAAPMADVFTFIFGILIFIPSIICWEIIKFFKKN